MLGRKTIAEVLNCAAPIASPIDRLSGQGPEGYGEPPPPTADSPLRLHYGVEIDDFATRLQSDTPTVDSLGLDPNDGSMDGKFLDLSASLLVPACVMVVVLLLSPGLLCPGARAAAGTAACPHH